MFCGHCGKKIENGSKFCQYCGIRNEENSTSNFQVEKAKVTKFVKMKRRTLVCIIAVTVCFSVALISLCFVNIDSNSGERNRSSSSKKTEEKDPEKEILGSWRTEEGDRITILSDNTYRVEENSDHIYEYGYDSGEWIYLEEEDFYKFYANNYYGSIYAVEIKKDDKGTYIKYGPYGVFYKE